MDQPVPPTTPQQERMQAIANTAGFHFATLNQLAAAAHKARRQVEDVDDLIDSLFDF
jgi:hypothetical protein